MSEPTQSLPARLTSMLRRRPRGLFTDVDGTISPIAATPESAILLPGARAALERALTVFDVVAAISGRSVDDLAGMVNIPGMLLIGNHGLERREAGTSVLDEAARKWIASVAAALDAAEHALTPHIAGMRVERKGVTGSIHLRQTADPVAAEATALSVLMPLAEAHGLHITRGRMVLEVRPPVSIDKGTAVATVVRERGLRSVVYLGDDMTDLDAFRALRQLDTEDACEAFLVAVASAEGPVALWAEASLVLDSVESTVRFLDELSTMP